MDVPFLVLKKDVPLELSKYIREYVTDGRRNGCYNTWAKNAIKQHQRTAKRLYRACNISKVRRVEVSRRAKDNRRSKNTRNAEHAAKNGPKNKFGMLAPRNTFEALEFDAVSIGMRSHSCPCVCKQL